VSTYLDYGAYSLQYDEHQEDGAWLWSGTVRGPGEEIIDYIVDKASEREFLEEGLDVLSHRIAYDRQLLAIAETAAQKDLNSLPERYPSNEPPT
jgi:hypothetical protein